MILSAFIRLDHGLTRKERRVLGNRLILVAKTPLLTWFLPPLGVQTLTVAS